MAPGGTIGKTNGSAYPLVKKMHNYGNSQFYVGKSTISIAIFNSYVKLPSGKLTVCYGKSQFVYR
jgi:hypothetical protein